MPLKNGRTTASLQTILVGTVIPPGVIQAFGGGGGTGKTLNIDASLSSSIYQTTTETRPTNANVNYIIKV
jgi:hypothetical protein